MRLLVLTATALLLSGVTASAQDQDPPTRAGRLAMFQGAVSIRPASDTEWAAAQPNRPLTTGDRVWTDTNARAEVQVGSTRLRLSSGTEMDIANLDDNTLQVSIPQGTLTARVPRLENGDADEIDTPNAAIGIGQAGNYRIDISPDGNSSTIKVFSGQVRVTAAGSSFDVNAHQQATVNGTDQPTYDLADLGPGDGWDQWNDDRDRREEASASARYVSADIAGYDDLDGNGDWRDDPTYGPVWTPTTVVVGWSPYHYGHWVWTGRWGWTWVDDAPWGWAPFHYGRWVYVEDHWGWCPGRVYERPVYAPALVAFVGGRGWNVGVSFGGGVGVGWFPLAPEEPYYPAYHVSNTYIRNVNVTNVTNVTNITNVTNVTNVTNITYRNRSLPGAVTVVPDNAFRNGQPVSRYAVRVPPSAIQNAPRLGSAAPFVPTQRSIAPIASEHRPPPAITNRTVVAVRQPPKAPPSFAEQAKLIEAHPGRPLAPTEIASIKRPEAPPVVPVRPANEPVRPGVTLKPARPAIATTPAAPKPVTRPGFVATPAPRPTPAVPRPPIAEPTRGPATATRVPQPPPRPTISTAPAPNRNLQQQYQQQRDQMENRHAQEAANPPTTATPQQVAKQQADEHRALDNNYVQARSSGARSMPAPPPPRPPQPAARPAEPAPAPRPAAPAPRPAPQPRPRKP
ncbi:MAG TPA: DUF6600 domain-containing protein [Gemmatimonadaceae bacterium]|nr:DUF6600 domain-containing protein [Gemmatimonadaceae bacterium]